MRKLALFLSLILFMGLGTLMAQTKAISGKVVDNLGEAIPGVSIIVKGTTVGTISRPDGTYNLNVPEDAAAIVFTFVGMQMQEIPFTGQATINVTLKPDAIDVDEVVVTALGMKRSEKAIGYAVQNVSGEQLSKVKEASLTNALSGKVAGVQVTSSSGSVGASSRIVLRGASSITGNNQPLFVIDGVPLDNTNYGDAGSGGGVDLPDGISDLSSDDIASVTILKGPSAAALYGLRAANGVIVVTTKTGDSGKKGLGVTYNGSVTFEKPFILPDFQNSYGQGSNDTYFEWIDGTIGDGGVDESWGPALDTGLEFVQWNSYTVNGEALPWVSQPDNVKDFYETGVTNNHNVSISGGSEKGAFRLSLGYQDQTGIIPNTDITRYTVGTNSSITMAEKLTASVNFNYTKTESDNLPTGGYNNENPVQQMIWSGRNVDFNALKDYKNLPDSPDGTIAAGTPLNWNTVFQNNPFWVLNTNLNGFSKDRVVGATTLKYDITPWLYAQGKASVDHYSQLETNRKAKGSNEYKEGYYREITRRYSETNLEFLLSATKKINEDFDFSATVGANGLERKYSRVTGEVEQLELPNFYSLSNAKSGTNTISSNYKRNEELNSVFAFGQFGFRNMVFLDWTARNDWSSILPEANNSFFYPSVTLSGILSDAFDLSSAKISFLKLRAGWAKVGGTGALTAYAVNDVYAFRDSKWGDVSLAYLPNRYNNPNLKAETTTGIEFGMDARFFNNKLRLDATYYNQTSEDLIVDVDISPASGYTSGWDNVGEMKNTGVEIMLGATVYEANDLSIDVDLNFAKNKNEVVSLGGLDALVLGGQWNVELQAREGHAWGDLVGRGFERTDDGQIIYEDGLPVIDSDVKVLGNIAPDWTGGANLTVNYKNFTLSTLIDAKIGGDVHSMTYAWGRYAGVLQETLVGRETGLVAPGVKLDESGNYVANDVVVTAKAYNQSAYGNSVDESAIFDASYVKWRNLSLTYNLPKVWLSNTFISDASVSFIGRNLAMLYRKAPHIDPETGFSSENGEQGQEFGQLPSTRSFGFNINLKF